MRIEFEDIINEFDDAHIVETKWHQSRRVFISNILAGSALLTIPWLASCEINSKKNFDGKGIFTNSEMGLLHSIQNTLFPDDANGPSASDVNAHNYLIWYLSDELLDRKDYNYFVDGFMSFKKFALSTYSSSQILENLTSSQWESLINNATKIVEHKNWLSRILTLIFEALLLDPIYGGNTNEIGWQWLNHVPGNPRPTNELKYPNYVSIIHAPYEI